MTFADHVRQAEALLKQSDQREAPWADLCVKQAQVHATLAQALAAAYPHQARESGKTVDPNQSRTAVHAVADAFTRGVGE